MLQNLVDTKYKQDELLDNLWMGLGDTRLIKTRNPLDNRTDFDKENPDIFLLRLMRNPDYFGFTVRHIFNIQLLPIQIAIMKELWIRPFPILVGCRGLGKSFLLGLYALLKSLLVQGSKCVIIGGGFRQAKHVFEYCSTIWRGAPIFQDLLGHNKRFEPKYNVDRCTFQIGLSKITALPLGNGEKIRGERATDLITDEFHTVQEDVFEQVVSGFASVSASPFERAREYARLQYLMERGIITPEEVDYQKSLGNSNKSIIAGTANYQFNHFYRYVERYKNIINSRGDISNLIDTDESIVDEGFDCNDYSVIRIPIELVQGGYMDEKNVARSKMTITNSAYRMEFSAIFEADSDGFFSRRLIESCVVGKSGAPIVLSGHDHPINFTATLWSQHSNICKYVYGIDPASEVDNFSIVILEVWPDHRRVVYCWTATKKKHRKLLNKGLTVEQNFYSFCARKIRDLMKRFPTECLVCDAGGGIQVREALADEKILEQGEHRIFEVIDEDDPKDSDNWAGKHILHMVNFSKTDWVAEANHGLKRDLGDKVILFPRFDGIALAEEAEERKLANRYKEEYADGADEDDIISLYETLEDCMMEIEEMKDELATIIISLTQTGKEHWDVPRSNIPGVKTKLRKDRYSALLIANGIARKIALTPAQPVHEDYGGIASDIAKSKTLGPEYIAPEWFKSQYCNGAAVYKNMGKANKHYNGY